MDTHKPFFRASYTGFRRCPEIRWVASGCGLGYVALKSDCGQLFSIPRRTKVRVKMQKSPRRGIQISPPGRGLSREPSLTTKPFPLADNQSEYSVGSEEEDEDFDERPEGGMSFPDFLSHLFPFHFPWSFKPTVFMQIMLFCRKSKDYR